MKISAVKTYILKYKLDKPLKWANRGISERSLLLVEIVTDEGISGWGECHLAVEPIKALIDSLLSSLMIGKDPLDIEQLWATLYNRTIRFGQKGIAICAIGALDLALWDLAGKILNQPLYKLLGGKRFNEVTPYATGFYFQDKPDFSADFAAEAEGYLQDGYNAMKLKVGLGVKEDLRNVKAVRQVVGEETLVMVDATWGFDLNTAKILGRGLEELGVYWFEEPLAPEQLDGYSELASYLDIAVAGIESEYTMVNFKRILDKRAVDILQPDIVTAGGITECRKIASLAKLYGVPIALHLWSSAIALSAGIHFMVSLPPLTPSLYGDTPPLIEFDRTPNPFREELVENPPVSKEGKIAVPEGPGLGVVINREVLKRYCVSAN